jgi:hypothetical protein
MGSPAALVIPRDPDYDRSRLIFLAPICFHFFLVCFHLKGGRLVGAGVLLMQAAWRCSWLLPSRVSCVRLCPSLLLLLHLCRILLLLVDLS